MLGSERKALMELMNNDEIVIRHADKGCAIVVQDKSAYVNEIKTQLCDRLTYTLLDTDPTFRFGQEIKDTLKHHLHDGRISDNEYKYTIKDNSIRPMLYTCLKFTRTWKIHLDGL